MWNRDPGLAEEIIADGFILHAAGDLSGLETLRDGQTLRRLVTGFRAQFSELVFEISEPFVDVEKGTVIGPWTSDATPLTGAPHRSCGIDILRVRDGRIFEVWTTSKETAVSSTVAAWRDVDAHAKGT